MRLTEKNSVRAEIFCGLSGQVRTSPLFGKDKMTTFERYFIADKETHKETKGAYYHLLENEEVVDGMIRRIWIGSGSRPYHQWTCSGASGGW